MDKTPAVQFRDFLTTRQAADIFESWAWSRPLPGWTSLGIRSHVCLACQIADGDSKNSPEKQLEGIRELVGDYKSAGVAPSDVHISAVVEGDAGYALLKDTSYVALTKKGRSNPNSAVIDELLESGVSVELSIQTMKEKGWTKDDLLPGVKVVDNATTRIGQLEQQGYTRMKL
jgi:intracellular sulfur oxidation DsrE/DsrF family protein